MRERIQVGRLLFDVDMPYPYLWGEKDLPFLVKRETKYRRKIHVHIQNEENLEEPQEFPLHDDEGIRVWNAGQTEIRSFRAFFHKDNRLYAISRWHNDQIDIQFKFSTLVWGHPNMVMWPLLQLESQLLLTHSLILHSCYTQYQGEAILFTAPSGTGKTTQGNLWRKVYNAEIVNGDLCLLQQQGSAWKACGYPMSGSAPECKNKSYPIKAIVVVRQHLVNHIEELSESRKMGLVYSECTVNTWNAQRVAQALDLTIDLVRKVPVLMLHCNMEDDAAHLLHKYLYNK